jgi:hypothetical protein
MRVLVACEYSGIVRDAFRARGHDAWSCDLLPTEKPIWTYDQQTGTKTHHPERGYHYEGDVLDLLHDGWDLMIAHPPCTYLTSSGLHWNKRRPERAAQTEDALQFVLMLANAPIPRIAIENPVGCLSTRWRKPDQTIQPHQFGHDASKSTCLWLTNLPKLVATKAVAPRMVDGKPRWSNQTDSGQNRVPPGPDQWKIRSTTYQGIADAMAEQWGTI